ncbi:jockey\pol [Symbiodinium sp. CCMP2456]|nr:jockey\pol [Symbiodinium sp. CCMP2456]
MDDMLQAELEAESSMERTPWNEADGPTPAHLLVPRGPPPPVPVGGWPEPSSHRRADDGLTPAVASDSDSHPSQRWPVLREQDERGDMVTTRVQGPHLPSGRFEDSSSPSSGGSDLRALTSDGDDDGDAASDGEAAHSDTSWTWSDTTLILEGSDFRDAGEYLIGQYRLELRDVHAHMANRVVGGKVAALRRQLSRGLVSGTWLAKNSRETGWPGRWTTSTMPPTIGYHVAFDVQPEMMYERWLLRSACRLHGCAQHLHSQPRKRICRQVLYLFHCRHVKVSEQGRLAERSSGLLVMLHRAAFYEVAAQELHHVILAGDFNGCLSPAGHWPEHATAGLLPYRSCAPKLPDKTAACNVQALQQAVASQSPAAQALQRDVAEQLARCAVQDPVVAQLQINQVLLQAACEHFPIQPREDHRVSAQPEYRASAKHTWRLYARMKAHAHPTLPVIWLKWRAAIRFRQASLALRAQSRQLKKQFLLTQVEQAAAAAARGDQRSLYQVVLRLTPRSHRGISRMLGPDGKLLTAPQELEAIIRYGSRTFAALPDQLQLCSTAHNLIISDEALATELAHLGLRKVLGPSLRRHFQAPGQRLQFSLSKMLLIAFTNIGASELAAALGDAASHALRAQGVAAEVINAVQQLHLRAEHHYSVGAHKGGTSTTNGIKQGCKIAPYLWCYFTTAFLERLIAARDLHWVLATLTLFADDVWGNWVIRQVSDFTRAMQDLELLLTTLEAMHLQINFKKTAILLKLVGRGAERVLLQHTSYQAGQRRLHLQVSGRRCVIPIREQHEYLGTVVSYTGRVSGNVRKRQKAAQGRQQAIRRALNGQHALLAAHRVSLWRSCVYTSALYSLPFVGCHERSLEALDRALVKHLRAILRIPAHISHITNTEVWAQAQVDRPLVAILRQLKAHVDKRRAQYQTAPDITAEAKALNYASDLIRFFESLLRRETGASPESGSMMASSAPVPCTVCDKSFTTLNAMRIHCKLQHGYLPEHPRVPTRFDAAMHSVGGLPECKLCRRRFFRWQQLQKHIETGACSALGGVREEEAACMF